MWYLYSADISYHYAVFANLKEALKGTDFYDLVPMVPENAPSSIGVAISSSHQEDMENSWISATTVAGQYYSGTLGTEINKNMYDYSASYKSEVDTLQSGFLSTYKNLSTDAFGKGVPSILDISSGGKRSVDEGNGQVEKYVVIVNFESVDVIYTSVNVTSDTAKESAVVSTPPTAKNLTYTGSAQELVTAGTATGGTMQYVLGKDSTTAPVSGWNASVPTGTKAGTYYVWYMAKGDNSHTNSAAKCVTVTINEKAKDPADKKDNKEGGKDGSGTPKQSETETPQQGGNGSGNNSTSAGSTTETPTTTTTTAPLATTEPTTTTPTTAPKIAVEQPTSQQEKITIMKAPVLKKLKAKKNKVQITWKKIRKNKAGKKLFKQIRYIEVQAATDPAFKNIVATKNVGKKKTKTILKLQRKTVYYVRVRYVGTDGVSKWSKVKKVKTK